MNNMRIGVVNQSTQVDAASVGLMVRACNTQIKRDVAPKWMRLPAPVKLYARLESVPVDSWLVVILDNADQAGALGYHDETPDGRVYGRVFAKTVLDNGGTVLSGANSVSVTLSHEIAEMFCDPNINTWADDGGSKEIAWEVGDPVENTSYDIDVTTVAGSGFNTVKVAVSNFVLMSYFDVQNKTGPYDMLGLLRKPWSMLPGGYLIKRSGGVVTQSFGREVPRWKRAAKQFPAARTSRRRRTTPPRLTVL